MIVVVIEQIKESWRRFKESEPGHRFQDSYHRRQRSERGRFSFTRIFNIAVGSVLVVFSAFFGWAPGPGLVTFFLGLALIAGELSPVAKLLDWAEVRLRKLARQAGSIWIISSPPVRILIILIVLICVIAAVYGAYSLLFGG